MSSLLMTQSEEIRLLRARISAQQAQQRRTVEVKDAEIVRHIQSLSRVHRRVDEIGVEYRKVVDCNRELQATSERKQVALQEANALVTDLHKRLIAQHRGASKMAGPPGLEQHRPAESALPELSRQPERPQRPASDVENHAVPPPTRRMGLGIKLKPGTLSLRRAAVPLAGRDSNGGGEPGAEASLESGAVSDKSPRGGASCSRRELAAGSPPASPSVCEEGEFDVVEDSCSQGKDGPSADDDVVARASPAPPPSSPVRDGGPSPSAPSSSGSERSLTVELLPAKPPDSRPTACCWTLGSPPPPDPDGGVQQAAAAAVRAVNEPSSYLPAGKLPASLPTSLPPPPTWDDVLDGSTDASLSERPQSPGPASAEPAPILAPSTSPFRLPSTPRLSPWRGPGSEGAMAAGTQRPRRSRLVVDELDDELPPRASPVMSRAPAPTPALPPPSLRPLPVALASPEYVASYCSSFARTRTALPLLPDSSEDEAEEELDGGALQPVHLPQGRRRCSMIAALARPSYKEPSLTSELHKNGPHVLRSAPSGASTQQKLRTFSLYD